MSKFNDLNLEFRNSDYHGNDWLWPREDWIAWKHLNNHKHRDFPEKISKFCETKDLVIQAGGNCGLYPKQYAKFFNKVITVEPDYVNFFCLSHNVPDQNVFKFQCCLGNSSTFLNLNFNPQWNEKNLGALRISGEGIIPQITIDSLNVRPNLIHLDIEGFEGAALEGAAETIKSCHPLIVLETNGSGDEYGWPQNRIDELLFAWGYKILEKYTYDTIYSFK